jgi:hypothetical protein
MLSANPTFTNEYLRVLRKVIDRLYNIGYNEDVNKKNRRVARTIGGTIQREAKHGEEARN